MKRIDMYFDKAIEEGKIDRYPTFKTMAEVLNVPYGGLYRISTHRWGTKLDESERNWRGITDYILIRLDPDHGFASLEEYVEKVIETEKHKIRTGELKRYNYTKPYEYEGKTIVGRKVQLQQGDKVLLKDKKLYDVIVVTQTHVVFQVPETPILLCLNNATLNVRFDKVVNTNEN